MRRKNNKVWWYRWTDYAYKPIVLWRVTFFVLAGVLVIGLFTYETFPIIFPVTALVALAALAFLMTRHVVRVFLYWLHCLRSKRGKVVISFMPQKWLYEFFAMPTETIVEEEP